MAVVRVTESWKQQGASVEGWPGVKPIIVGTHRLFTVKFDVASPNNQLNALTSNDGTTAIPAVGSYWGNAATYLTCRRVQVLDPIGPTLYRVMCEYSGMLSPFTQAPILRYSGIKYGAEMGYDATGKFYQNTMGERLTGHTRDFYDRIFTLTRNEATDLNAGGSTWRGVVNLAPLTLGDLPAFPAKSVKIEDISATREPMPGTVGVLAATVTSVTYSGGVYTVNVSSGTGFPNGSIIGANDGVNGIQGTVASGGGTTALVLSNTGLTTTGTPTALASGTGAIWVAPGVGLTYFYPTTYTLAVRTNVVTINGGSATDIGWQYLECNHGSVYRAATGGPPRSTAKYLGVPDWPLHQDGTLWIPPPQGTDTASTLYWLLYDDFLPVDFSTLALST
jgi:hypothetical protein